MVDKNFVRDLKRNKPPGSRGCSNLYRYLLEHWAELRAAGYGMDGGPTWQELTDRLTRHGQVNARGAPLKRLRVREVFLRVQAEILAQETQRKTGVAVRPQVAKAPAGWKPPVVARPDPPKTNPSPFARSGPTAGNDASDDMSPEELMAGIRDVIAKRSGR